MTLTPNKLYTLPTVGADFNTWGGELNADLELIDKNVGGALAISVAGGVDYTPNAAQASNAVQLLFGALTADIDYLLPARPGVYTILNVTSGNHKITVGTVSGSFAVGVVLHPGATQLVWSNGQDVFPVAPVGVPDYAPNGTGYVQNGPILFQWGSGVTDGIGQATVTFPRFFSAASYQVYASVSDGNPLSVAKVTTAPGGQVNGTQVYSQNSITGAFAASVPFSWFAVGPY